MSESVPAVDDETYWASAMRELEMPTKVDTELIQKTNSVQGKQLRAIRTSYKGSISGRQLFTLWYSKNPRVEEFTKSDEAGLEGGKRTKIKRNSDKCADASCANLRLFRTFP